jgi:20S proteasome alpha/beta subunit
MNNEKTKANEKKAKTPPDILLPKEIKLLKEFNEARKEKYYQWVQRRIITEEILGKYTLVVGVRGRDGIVLGADTKVIRGGETDYEHKVRKFEIGPQSPIIFASAGAVGVIEDFVEMFEETLKSNIKEGKVNSLLSIKIIAENLVETMEERYGPKLQQPSLHFILGGLSKLNNGKAVLYEIGFPGFGQKIKYNTFVGHGSPYARTIGKYLFPRNNNLKTIDLNCKDIVNRTAFCIQWIGDDIDNYVGIDAQIMYLLDDKPCVHDGSFKKQKIQNKVRNIRKEFETITFK